MRNQQTSQMHKLDKVFLPNHIEINKQKFFDWINGKSSVTSYFYISGRGLNREGAYSQFWLRREELIREGRFIERGLNIAFTVRQERCYKCQLSFRFIRNISRIDTYSVNTAEGWYIRAQLVTQGCRVCYLANKFTSMKCKQNGNSGRKRSINKCVASCLSKRCLPEERQQIYPSFWKHSRQPYMKSWKCNGFITIERNSELNRRKFPTQLKKFQTQ